MKPVYRGISSPMNPKGIGKGRPMARKREPRWTTFDWLSLALWLIVAALILGYAIFGG